MYKAKNYFGIVEGFFSKPLQPWTNEERKLSINFIDEYAKGLDTYFYCPKDDQYVTKSWDKLYPVKEANELKGLMDLSEEKGITFVYGLNPLITDRVDWKYLRKKTIEKFDQLIALGCRNICLLFDDIPLAYDVVDSNIDEIDISESLVKFVNEIYQYFVDRVDDFWLCSPDYCFRNQTVLTDALKQLDKNIGVIWTGNEIFSESISRKDVERVRGLLSPEVRIIYWSNYPVNDCEQAVGTFNLGGFPSIDLDVLNVIDGIVVNPMRECYANFPFYITFSDYIKSGADYDRNGAWDRALTRLGINETTKKILGNFSSSNFVDQRKCLIGDLGREVSGTENDRAGTDNKYGGIFCETVNRVFEDATLFEELRLSLSLSNKVEKNSFVEFDWFPTGTGEARWFAEIVRILKGKYSQYSVYYQKDLFKDCEELSAYFQSKYKGKGKLQISPIDGQKFLQCIRDLVGVEQSLFFDLLNNPAINAHKKLEMLSARKNINRFTVI